MLLVEVAVDRRAAHTELGGDLRDGVPTLAVRPRFVIHLSREFHLPWSELRLLSAGAAARRAAARPSIVRSDINACSNSAIAPMI